MYKIGDRIIIEEILTNIYNTIGPRKGDIGTIIGIYEDYITVEFDNKINDGHDGDIGEGYKGKYGHCWGVDITSYYKVGIVVPNNPLSKVLYPDYIVDPENPDYLIPRK